jgi:hypothetical protein
LFHPPFPLAAGLPGLHVDFTTEQSKIPSLTGLANLYSSGTSPLKRAHPLGNNNQFHPDLRGFSRVRVYLGTINGLFGVRQLL